MAEASGSRRVVIVGGGLAGLFAARALRSAPVQVILLDRSEHHLFPPLLYQCAAGILSEGKIAYPLRHLLEPLRNLEFVLAEVTGLDAQQRRVLARRPLAIMLIGGLVEVFLGVNAAGKSLETVTKPLTSTDEATPATQAATAPAA